MNTTDIIYNEMINAILEKNSYKDDRTQTGTISLVGYTARYPMTSYYESYDLVIPQFPLLTSKEVNFQNIVTELMWFITGQTNIYSLEKCNNHIWCDWPLKYYNQKNPGSELSRKDFQNAIVNDIEFAKTWGELGPVYGKQWRAWDSVDGFCIDQFKSLLNDVKNNPNSRRIIVSAWNPDDIAEMSKSGLPPCHTMYQVIVKNGKVNLLLYQRSLDSMLGAPYNIATYSLLIGLIAEYAGLEVGDFIHMIGDCHIYVNHIEAVKEQMNRPLRGSPSVIIKADALHYLMQEKVGDMEINYSEFQSLFELKNYDPHPPIRVPVAI